MWDFMWDKCTFKEVSDTDVTVTEKGNRKRKYEHELNSAFSNDMGEVMLKPSSSARSVLSLSRNQQRNSRNLTTMTGNMEHGIPAHFSLCAQTTQSGL